MTAVLMRPVDTFFFRDHRPLSIGEDAAATGIFPPRPGTVYGALRSAYIHRHSDFQTFAAGTNASLRRWMGTPREIGQFALRNIFMHDGKEPILPLPLDYQVVKEASGEEMALPLRLTREEAVLASDGETHRLYAREEKKSSSAAGAYVGEALWKQALLEGGKLPVMRQDKWLVQEEKVGIARSERTKQAIDGMLYQMPMLRFKRKKDEPFDPGLLVSYDQAPDFSDVPYAQLGGEGRPWRISVIGDQTSFFSHAEEAKIIEHIQESGIARIIWLTPAIWKRGNRPAGYDPDNQTIELASGLRVKLLTAAIGRPRLIGGWDIAAQRPKPRRPAIPAGSVLYVKVRQEQAEAFVRAVHRQNWTDDLAHEGYGFAVCGAYHSETLTKKSGLAEKKEGE